MAISPLIASPSLYFPKRIIDETKVDEIKDYDISECCQ